MKILLINPATRRYIKENGEATCKNGTMPLGIMFIASFIEKHGYDVKILDVTIEGYYTEKIIDKNNIRYGQPIEDIEKFITDYSPDAVGVTCIQSMRYYEVLEVCSIVKTINKRTPVIVGGSHVTGAPRECLENENIDYAVIGEGEITFLKLLKFLEHKEDINNIRGLGYKTLDSRREIVINPGAEWIADLDSMPMPAWHLVPMEKYFEIGVGPSQKMLNRYALLVTSRGCPHKCNYCPSFKCWGEKYRSMSPQRVLQEIQYLYEKYDIRTILFEEHNFITNKKRVMEICSLLKQNNLKINWSAPNGMEVNCLDYEYIKEMASAGCDMLHLAVETTSKKVYDKLDKKVNYDHVHDVIKWGKECGMQIAAFFMLGFPGETKEDIENSIEYSTQIDADYVHFFIPTPLPGTPLFDECIEKKYISFPIDYSRLRYNIGNITTADFNPEEIENYRRNAWLKVMAKKVTKKDVWGNL
ncbi:MAG: B12-binding domain-containing radical SAM protein [Oligoflexia bacterium]|nr:B12-binding domain-containing radical SAM protein [Oligoflexia bacterium]